MKPSSETSRSPTPSHATLPALERPPATLLDYLAERFPHVGKETWRARIAAGHVTFDDDAPLSVATSYRAGARIRYFREVAEEPAVPFGEEILFENTHLLVVDKPHFLPVIPGGPWVNECLLYRLRRRLGNRDLVVVHRLDRETAGLVLCCKDPAVRGLYGRLFQEGRVEKEYLAVARVTDPPRRESYRRGEPAGAGRAVVPDAGRPRAAQRADPGRAHRLARRPWPFSPDARDRQNAPAARAPGGAGLPSGQRPNLPGAPAGGSARLYAAPAAAGQRSAFS